MPDELSREERVRNLNNALNQAFNDDMPDSILSGITTRVVQGTAGEPSAHIDILSGGRVIARESEELIYAATNQFSSRRNTNTEFARRRILADMEANMVVRYLDANTHPERGLQVQNIIFPADPLAQSSERFRFETGMRNNRGEDLMQRIDLWFSRRDSDGILVTGHTQISVAGLHRTLERSDNEQRGRLLAAISDTAPSLLQNIPDRLRPETGPGSVAQFRTSEAERRRLAAQLPSQLQSMAATLGTRTALPFNHTLPGQDISILRVTPPGQPNPVIEITLAGHDTIRTTPAALRAALDDLARSNPAALEMVAGRPNAAGNTRLAAVQDILPPSSVPAPQPVTIILSKPGDPNNPRFGPDLLPLPGPTICRITGYYVGEGHNRRFQIAHLDLDEGGRWVQHDELLAIPGAQDLRRVRLPLTSFSDVPNRPNFGSIVDQIRGRIDEFREAEQRRRGAGGRQSNLMPSPNLNLTMTPVDILTALNAAPNAPLNPQVLSNTPERDGHG